MALSKRQLNIANVNDARALQSIHPELRFADAVDKSTSFRSVQMTISPILAGGAMLGVLEVINNKMVYLSRKFNLMPVLGFLKHWPLPYSVLNKMAAQH